MPLAVGWIVVLVALWMGRSPQPRETITKPKWNRNLCILSMDGRIAAMMLRPDQAGFSKADGNAFSQQSELWNLDKHEFIGIATVSSFGSFAVSADRGMAAFTRDNNTIEILDIQHKKRMCVIHRRETMPEVMVFSSDGRRLLVCTGLSVHEWDTATGQQLTAVHTVAKNWLAGWYTPEGKARGASLVSPRTVIVWDLECMAELSRIQPAATGAIQGTTITSDGKLLAMAPMDAPVEIWDLQSASLLGQYPVPRVPARLVFSPDGGHVAVSHGAAPYMAAPAYKVSAELGDMVMHNLSPAVGTAVIDRARGTISTGAPFAVGMAITSDAKTLVTVNNDGMQLWDLPLKQRLAAWWVWLALVLLCVMTIRLIVSWRRNRILAQKAA